MAWKSVSQPPPAPASVLSKLLPLLVLLAIVVVVAIVCFYSYCCASDIASAAENKLKKKRIVCSKDGIKVSMRCPEDEKYVDRTQRYGTNSRLTVVCVMEQNGLTCGIWNCSQLPRQGVEFGDVVCAWLKEPFLEQQGWWIRKTVSVPPHPTSPQELTLLERMLLTFPQ
jgi:hypothetical protein